MKAPTAQARAQPLLHGGDHARHVRFGASIRYKRAVDGIVEGDLGAARALRTVEQYVVILWRMVHAKEVCPAVWTGEVLWVQVWRLNLR
jgi:hypothetical protein